jgi:hypothetical protein
MFATRTVLLTTAISALFFAAQLVPAQETAVSIQRAVQQGLVDVEVSSLGGATGSTIQVNVRRKVATNVKVEINAGTMFAAPTATVQNMAGGVITGEYNNEGAFNPGRTSVVVLADTNWHRYAVESFCMDFHRGPPVRGQQFGLVVEDQRAVRIMQAGKTRRASLWAVQFALWMDRDGISEPDLLAQYGQYVTEADVAMARTLIRDAEQAGVTSVPANMPSNVKVEVKKLFSPDPAVRGAAVKVLVGMGRQAESAAPYLADNVPTPQPAQLNRSAWVEVLTNNTSVKVDANGLPDLNALVNALQQWRKEHQQLREERLKDKPNSNRPTPLRERIRDRLQNGVK